MRRHRWPRPLALRLALRDLRGGFSGFLIFLICIALGTGAIGAVNGVADALREALSREGKIIIGGDAVATRMHRQASASERAFLDSQGEVGEIATLRAMARKPDGSAQALVEVKAVDAAYPLYGKVELAGGGSLDHAVHTTRGVAVDRALLDQLRVRLGDVIAVGEASFPINAIVEREPDRLAAGPSFGARIILSFDSLKKTGLAGPGSLVRWSYRLKAPELAGRKLKQALAEKFPDAAFEVRDSGDPSPDVSEALQRLAEFLTLAGLTAMLTGGIGVANAVTEFIARRRKTIAAYKALGASQPLILRAFLVEIALLAVIGLAFGILISAAVPWLAMRSLGTMFPVAIEPRLYPEALGLPALFGGLTAAPFILWPLGAAQRVRAAELLRSEAQEPPMAPPRAYSAASVLAVAALAVAAILLLPEKRIAAFACLGLSALFALFFAAGTGIRRLATWLPRPKRAAMTLARANLSGPASLTRTVALSLGLGLTLLTAVALVDASLTAELETRLPEHAPSHFLIGIPKGGLEALRDLIKQRAPDARFAAAPMLRGRLTALHGVPVEKIKPPAGMAWVLDGDRGITYSEAVPEGSKVTEGAWWPANYEGELLVSFEADIAKALGLKLGDTVRVNVLGRNLTAKIANFRKVRWGSIGINFVMVFSPNALRDAPFTWLGTLAWPEGKPHANQEGEVLRAIGAQFSTVSTIRVRDVLDAITRVFEKVMTAVRLAGAVTLLMGLVVVAGALLTAQRRRLKDGVILRVLGASKWRIMAAHLLEYAALAVSVAIIASAAGALAAWLVVRFVMEIGLSVPSWALLQPSFAETIFVLSLGAIGTFKVLSAKPASWLRSE